MCWMSYREASHHIALGEPYIGWPWQSVREGFESRMLSVTKASTLENYHAKIHGQIRLQMQNV
jgi:hypothetical protein